jgi:phenylpyruvate tautomerase PptA (4-oxalocrotonate tautomerase family)
MAATLHAEEDVVREEGQERTMPHVIVKLFSGRSERQRIRLVQEIVKEVVEIAKCQEGSVSVAVEEIKPEDRKGV